MEKLLVKMFSQFYRIIYCKSQMLDRCAGPIGHKSVGARALALTAIQEVEASSRLVTAWLRIMPSGSMTSTMGDFTIEKMLV